jgi:hypothetical protein
MTGTYLRLATIFLALNGIWEFLQLPLYTIWWSEPWSRIALALVHCTAGDLLIGASALVLAVIVAGPGWPADKRARRRIAVLTTLAGVGYTIFSEWLNVEVRQTWAYTDQMPRIPPLGTGLIPVLQWLTLPGLTLSLATVMRHLKAETRRRQARWPGGAASSPNRAGIPPHQRSHSPVQCGAWSCIPQPWAGATMTNVPDPEPGQAVSQQSAGADSEDQGADARGQFRDPAAECCWPS